LILSVPDEGYSRNVSTIIQDYDLWGGIIYGEFNFSFCNVNVFFLKEFMER